jgi:hypothetical protein
MHIDEPFPLDAVPSRMRNAILNEFQGRRPSVRDVAEIPDHYWLSTPDVGPAFLEKIHRVIGPQLPPTASPSSVRLSDAELLDRLERLQEEVQRLQDQLKARLSKLARRKPNRQWHKTAMQDADYQQSCQNPSLPQQPIDSST